MQPRFNKDNQAIRKPSDILFVEEICPGTASFSVSYDWEAAMWKVEKKKETKILFIQ